MMREDWPSLLGAMGAESIRGVSANFIIIERIISRHVFLRARYAFTYKYFAHIYTYRHNLLLYSIQYKDGAISGKPFIIPTNNVLLTIDERCAAASAPRD